jgi:hypothetical protein
MIFYFELHTQTIEIQSYKPKKRNLMEKNKEWNPPIFL